VLHYQRHQKILMEITCIEVHILTSVVRTRETLCVYNWIRSPGEEGEQTPKTVRTKGLEIGTSQSERNKGGPAFRGKKGGRFCSYVSGNTGRTNIKGHHRGMGRKKRVRDRRRRARKEKGLINSSPQGGEEHSSNRKRTPSTSRRV